MRKPVAIFLLVVVALPSLYKAGFWSYFQLNRDFIAANYCENRDQPITLCYGQCFFDRGIQLTNDIPNPDKLASPIKPEMPQSLPTDFSPLASVESEAVGFKFEKMPPLLDGIAFIVFRPPVKVV